HFSVSSASRVACDTASIGREGRGEGLRWIIVSSSSAVTAARQGTQHLAHFYMMDAVSDISFVSFVTLYVETLKGNRCDAESRGPGCDAERLQNLSKRRRPDRDGRRQIDCARVSQDRTEAGSSPVSWNQPEQPPEPA